jgi:hypothetical protein
MIGMGETYFLDTVAWNGPSVPVPNAEVISDE